MMTRVHDSPWNSRGDADSVAVAVATDAYDVGSCLFSMADSSSVIDLARTESSTAGLELEEFIPEEIVPLRIEVIPRRIT